VAFLKGGIFYGFLFMRFYAGRIEKDLDRPCLMIYEQDSEKTKIECLFRIDLVILST